ncbi:MAG: hypothetical protein AB7G28_26000 [Pirellulales bacterium]
MEPFFLRCETCQARLRVREERFLGQIQSCPKCGSMVQIVAPAGWLAQGEAAAESPPQLDEITATSTSSATASAVHWLRSHTIATAAGATGVIAACGLAALLALRGDEQVASLPTPAPAAQTTADTTAELAEEPVQQIDSAAETADTVVADETEHEVAHDDPVVAPESPSEPPQEPPQEPNVEQPVQAAASSSSFLPLITPPTVDTPTPSQEPQSPRKLTLELVRQDAKPAPAIVSPAVAAYPAEVEAEAAEIESANGAAAKPSGKLPAEAPVEASNLPSLDPPAHRTNIMDQLSMPIDSITLPDVPIGEFVGFVSTMTAVPIELDPKVLGEVGLSSRSTVTVHGEATTAGKLLARVLKEHQLTCVEREGTLVVVRAKR